MPDACLRAFPNAVLVGDDYGNYKDVENAVLECAREFNKVVHVDQNHCWTYAPLQSHTGLTFRPKPKKGSSFASLLGSYGKRRNVSMSPANPVAEELIQERQLVAERQGIMVVQRIVSKKCF